MQNFLLYIDPGSSSYFLQVIIGAVLGAMLYFKTLKMKIKAFFSRKKKDSNA
jgi:hypothetical protein